MKHVHPNFLWKYLVYWVWLQDTLGNQHCNISMPYQPSTDVIIFVIIIISIISENQKEKLICSCSYFYFVFISLKQFTKLHKYVFVRLYRLEIIGSLHRNTHTSHVSHLSNWLWRYAILRQRERNMKMVDLDRIGKRQKDIKARLSV